MAVDNEKEYRSNGESKPHVAIVGAGIAGVTLALGLLSRGVSVTVYERGSSFREIGAGIGFTDNAERAMKILDPRIHAGFKSVTVQNGTDWFMWMDGVAEGPSGNQEIHKMYLGERGFEGCHRADFLDALVKHVPENVIKFRQDLRDIEDGDMESPVLLRFKDGSVAHADVVVACDGINSRVRQLILGTANLASYPIYTHKYAFRGLIQMDKARAALGLDATQTRHMYLGPDSHALTFPVAGGNILNVVAFTTDQDDWPFEKFTAPAAKADAVKAFAGFNSTVRSIIDLLPDQLDKWAVFDTYDHPPETYSRGRVCLMGDAAHAAAPYHGAGAGFAIEDGAVLAHLLDTLPSGKPRGSAVQAALQAYDDVRRPRARWLVETSRFIGEMYQLQGKGVGDDLDKCAKEIEWRSRTIWDYDVEDMVKRAEEAVLAAKN